MKATERKYLSEATREIEVEVGEFNNIIAPVGSGKTTYVGKTLPNELEYEGLYIYLAPYTMLREQVIAEGLFHEYNETYSAELEGLIYFEEEATIEDLIKIDDNGGKIAMTIHKFVSLLQHNPQIRNRIGVLAIDESDHVFCNLPKWDRGQAENPFKYIKDIIADLMEDIIVIGITATGEDRLREVWGKDYNAITFAEKLKKIESDDMGNYSNLKLIFNEAIKLGKVCIYTESVRGMKEQAQYLESLGYIVDMIVSDSAKNYDMTPREKRIKYELATTGRSSLVGDVLIFNAAMERGVSIHDTSFKSIIIHSTVEDIQTQVVGRFRFDSMKVWKLSPVDERVRYENTTTDKDGRVSAEVVIPVEYIGVPLTTVMKKTLIKDIGFSKAWTSLKKVLIEEGYAIDDKILVVEKKSQRVSIIKK